MQKKWIAASLAMLLLVTPTLSFAEDNSLDEAYIDAVFGKLKEYDSDKKTFYSDGLKFNLRDSDIDDFQDTWKDKLKDHQAKKLEDMGLDDATIESNISKLKNWSEADRHRLIDLAASDDKAGLTALNNKYADSKTSPSNGGGGSESGNSSGSSSSSGGKSTGKSSNSDAVVQANTVQVNEEKTPEGVASRHKDLSEKGIRLKEIKPSSNSNVQTFNDLHNHWSKDSIDFFAGSGIISGRSSEKFEPDAPITKGEIVTLLAKTIVSEPEKLTVKTSTFADMSQEDWYKTYVDQLTALGVKITDKSNKVNGNSNPERQEIIKLFMDTLEALDLGDIESSPNDLMPFNDARKIKPENFNAMQNAVALGFIKGMGDGNLAPTEQVTRGQIAVMLKHFHEYIITKIKEEVA